MSKFYEWKVQEERLPEIWGPDTLVLVLTLEGRIRNVQIICLAMCNKNNLEESFVSPAAVASWSGWNQSTLPRNVTLDQAI